MTQRRLELKLPCGPAIPVIEGRERATAPDTSLVQQIEFDKQSGASPGQRHAQVGADIIGIDPSQRGPGIGEQACTLLRTGGLTGSARFGRHSRLEHLLNVAGMPAGRVRRFAAIDQLLHGIGLGGVKQAIACRGTIRPRRNQRLGDELSECIDSLIGRRTLIARHRKRALQRERTGENG